MIDVMGKIGEAEFDLARNSARHLRMSLLIILMETLMCLGYSYGNFVALDFLPWLGMMAAIWIISLALAWIVTHNPPAWLRGRQQVLLLTIWATTCFLVTSFYLDQFRISAIMFFFPILLMSSFRLTTLTLIAVCSYATLGYLLVLMLVLEQRPLEVSLSVEGLQWIIFAATTCSVVISGSAVSSAQRELTRISAGLRESARNAREQAIRDELTGLFNRRQILDVLQQQKALADSGDYSFVVCYLDLDHFKRINDTHGHSMGDEVLVRASELMRLSVRDADYCGRLGGEEFVLVLTGLDMASARRVVERLRARLESWDFGNPLGRGHVTLSAGLAQYQPAESVDRLLQRADALLYQAKEAGRNRIVCHEDEGQAATGD